MNPGSAKRILIAPLDWGLGHTTRCIPIIRRLLALNCEVVFAGNDLQQTFVTRIFPQIGFVHLPGYAVNYGRGALLPALLQQLPRLVRRVRMEHDWLLQLVADARIDGIISDNRYGLWHPEIPSVILTHQAEIQTGFTSVANGILRHIHYRFLNRFSACWIIDVAGEENLGGRLSHPQRLPRHSHYIGWLSQLVPSKQHKAGDHLLILLSGPEPQRSMLSDKLWQQVSSLSMPVVFVEGDAKAYRNNVPAHIRHFPRVAGAELQDLIEKAQIVVCRSGYSTLMDLLLLKKKAILIPTPGQTEQEYLARTLLHRGAFYAAPQKNFSLEKALEASVRFPFRLLAENGQHQLLAPVLDEWVNAIPVRL